MKKYQNKIKRERDFYRQQSFQKRHWLNNSPFFSNQREFFNFDYVMKQLSNTVRISIEKSGKKNPRILLAPVGSGQDLKYLQSLSDDISGIDISHEAIANIKNQNITLKVADMKRMTDFADNSFDIVVTSLFFHHYVKFGFDEFLVEINRVMKRGGIFFCLEPSIFYPLTWITLLGRKIFGNITGMLADESAFAPIRLTRAMKKIGFEKIQLAGASFSHNRFPIFIAKMNNLLTRPFLKIPFIRNFAWMCIFRASKR